MLRLRRDTREAHDRIEAALHLPRVLESVESYGRLLQRWYGFYAPVEAQLARHQIDGLDLIARKKVPLLCRDLGQLGLEAPAHYITGYDETETPARALGCLYVLEGSTLGGQLISRELHSRLGITADNGGAFYASYGSQIGPMWRQFGQVVESYACAHGGEDDMVDAARTTFERLRVWLGEGKS
jgi:heme oxygenase